MLFLQGLSDFLFVFCLMLAGEWNDELKEHKRRVVWPPLLGSEEVSFKKILYEYLKRVLEMQILEQE
jgi:hypothetical protein